jgi:hypothetical protein
MPSSPNRRRLEIPTALYARLEEAARGRQMTAAGLATLLLADALGRVEAAGGEGEGEALAAIRRGVDELLAAGARQADELGALRREVALVLPHLVSAAPVTAPLAPATQGARRGEFEEWAELRVGEQGGPAGRRAFQLLAFEEVRADLPPIVQEYLRLLLIGEMAQSPDLRAAYRRQARTLRERLEALPTGEGVERPREP